MYEREYTLYYEDFGSILSHGYGADVKTFCPFCHERRTDKSNKSLSINKNTWDFKCHYCGAHGRLISKRDEERKRMYAFVKPIKTYKKPAAPPHIEPSIDPSVTEYFKGRGISEATLLKAKVTKETTFFAQDGCEKGCIAFNYYIDGEHVNTKFRTRDKHFTLIAGAKTVPYNLDSIAESAYKKDEKKYCIITEGEIDTLTYIECGFEHCVSMPNGANANLEWMDDYVDSHFDKIETVYISTDSDKKGLEAKDELIRRFGADRVKIIVYPDGCKDINEVLVAHGPNAVKECFENAVDIEPEGIIEVDNVWESLDDLFYNGLQKGKTIGVPSLDRILSFKTGMLAIITGVPTSGKTYALNYILCRLNLLHDWKTAFFSPEFYPVREHIAQIIETLGGLRFKSGNYTLQSYQIIRDYTSRNFFWIDPDDTDIGSILDRAKFLIRKKGIRILVIDPFNSVTNKEKGSQKQDEYISDFLQKIRWFARKYNILVFLVMHPTKQQRLDTGLYPVIDLYACKGAAEIYDKADIGITIWRNEQENYCEFHVTKMKFRHLGDKGKATFKFNANNGRFSEILNREDAEKQKYTMVSVPVEWDNTNWVAQKLKSQQTQTDFNFEEQDNNMPFESPDNNIPF